MKRITVHLRGGKGVSYDSRSQADIDGLLAAAEKAWNGGIGGTVNVSGSPEFHINLAAIDMITISDTVAEATP